MSSPSHHDPASSAELQARERQAQRNAVVELVRVAPIAEELAERFAAAGHRLFLVGGSVRDALLGRLGTDLDFTTEARPEQVRELLNGWAETIWDTGIEFGTLGAYRHGTTVEITTFRADTYDRVSRNPDVAFGDSIDGDLVRRDFTVNAMAIELPSRTFIDRHDGMADLAARRLDTPAAPEDSFADDPLRMLRAARFVSQLGFTASDRVVQAMTDMAAEIARITPERVQVELSKLLCGEFPRRGVELLVETGLADHVLPEVPAMKLEIDEHHQHKDVYSHSLTVLDQAIDLERAADPEGEPDLVLRLAALLHDIGKPGTRRFESGGGVSFHHHEVVGAKMARKRLRALRYPKDVINQVADLVFLHLRFHGYSDGQWTDSAVRRYVNDAGPLLPRLHKLVRADCTTRNKRKAAGLQRAYDDLEERIARIEAAEDLAKVRPDLDGNEIMRLLGVEPGPVVGKAWKHLKELRLDRGPMSHEEAVEELHKWARDQGIDVP
ncbi:poly(A) polymerase [Saccharopolyspora antimicrobica]|uniref:Poly(A) polymerase n=1 Tax=Saccharopolyspora antimicrobica TaxID=455193 RepID=A0A1I4XBG6_9PSEU|nr:CCA tRNA nucleotidyltransferase [Saccharopolyspora antimicrobica]RKT84410.1 poly(A) polymerase [Saccharopolyspora antimicrobica]SFN22846.1 poly(A) polymerase [Saccharopolyspora antimicrobica]